MIKYIQYMGPMSSSTTWFSNLLKHNFKEQCGEKFLGKHSPEQFYNGIWRNGKHNPHTFTQEDYDETLFLFIHRDVFAWLASVRNHPHGAWHLQGKPMSTFIRSSFTAKSERIRPNCTYVNFMEMRKLKMSRWRDLIKEVKNVESFRYCDVIEDRLASIEKIAEKYSLTFKGGKADYIGRNISEDRLQYYIQRRYMAEFNKEDQAFILSQCDLDVESFFGYDYEGAL